MYEYYVYVGDFAYGFKRETYFPIQEFDDVCKRCLAGSSVERGFFILDSVLGNLGFELYDINGEGNSFCQMCIKVEEISVTFNYNNV